VKLMAKPKNPEKNFETSLSTLERIVAQLESGDMPLERSLELFEEGIGLVRHCQSQLQDAERKVELLLRERGEIKVVPFETEQANLQIEPNRTTRQNIAAVSQNEVEGEDEDDLDDTIPF
jgi:exodeoxyribonuclease VII small subunit